MFRIKLNRNPVGGRCITLSLTEKIIMGDVPKSAQQTQGWGETYRTPFNRKRIRAICITLSLTEIELGETCAAYSSAERGLGEGASNSAEIDLQFRSWEQSRRARCAWHRTVCTVKMSAARLTTAAPVIDRRCGESTVVRHSPLSRLTCGRKKDVD